MIDRAFSVLLSACFLTFSIAGSSAGDQVPARAFVDSDHGTPSWIEAGDRDCGK